MGICADQSPLGRQQKWAIRPIYFWSSVLYTRLGVTRVSVRARSLY